MLIWQHAQVSSGHTATGTVYCTDAENVNESSILTNQGRTRNAATSRGRMYRLALPGIVAIIKKGLALRDGMATWMCFCKPGRGEGLILGLMYEYIDMCMYRCVI